MAFLTIEREGGILTATMNKPETRKALTGNTAVQESVQLCDKVRRGVGAVMRRTKRLPHKGQQATLKSRLQQSASCQAIAHKTVDHREAVTAFIEQRTRRFQ